MSSPALHSVGRAPQLIHCLTSQLRCATVLPQHAFAGAVNPEVFEKVANVYRQHKQALGLADVPVPCQMAEDETKIDSSIEFDRGAHALVGFCGRSGVKHQCDVKGVHVQLPIDAGSGTLYSGLKHKLNFEGVVICALLVMLTLVYNLEWIIG